MASIKTTENSKNLQFNELLNLLQKNLPQYAIPKFIRVLRELKTTSTFKIKKSEMKRIGFDISKTNDPIYVLLLHSSEYIFLTEEIYKIIMNGKYRF